MDGGVGCVDNLEGVAAQHDVARLQLRRGIDSGYDVGTLSSAKRTRFHDGLFVELLGCPDAHACHERAGLRHLSAGGLR